MVWWPRLKLCGCGGVAETVCVMTIMVMVVRMTEVVVIVFGMISVAV